MFAFFYSFFFVVKSCMTLLVPIEPAIHSNLNTFPANRCSLCWLCTPFLCNWLFLPTHRTSQLSLSGCIYPLLIQSTHWAPAELQTNTVLSTGAMLRSALPFQEALNILIFRPFFVFRWHKLPRLLASQDGWEGLPESPLCCHGWPSALLCGQMPTLPQSIPHESAFYTWTLKNDQQKQSLTFL